MIYTFIADTDRTADIERGSLKKSDELQQRVDVTSFKLIDGTRPSQNQEVKIFDGDGIVSLSDTALVIDGDYSEFGKFRVGDDIWLGLGESTEEKVTISAVDGANITLTAAATNSHQVGFDVSTAVYSRKFSVKDKDGYPTDVEFNTDGTKMFILGGIGGDVLEYALTTGFDVSTASYTQNYSASALTGHPYGLNFNTDGTKMFIVDEVGVNEYALTTGFDISSASFTQLFDTTSENATPRGVNFNTNGTKMFVTGVWSADDNVYEYVLTTGFDVSTASYVYAFYVGDKETTPNAVEFNTDGTKMFILGDNDKKVYEYDLSTGFNISTAVYIDFFDVSNEEITPTGLAFNTTGTKMFVVGWDGDDVNEYDIEATSSEKMGKKIFGGTVQKIGDENRHSLANIIQRVECADYTKIFDKKLVNDSWKDRSTKYIINDFLNNFVNFNVELDSMEYANATAIRAEWIESGDGTDPNIDTSDFKEGDTAGVFAWTNSGGTATFSATPTSQSLVDLVGVTRAAPLSGVLAFWYKQADNTKVTSIKVRVGSDSSNYTEVTLTPESDNDWHYTRLNMKDGTETGTPVWNIVDYTAIIVTETGNSNVKIDGLRVNSDSSFTFDNVSDGVTFDDFRAGYKKPTRVMQILADQNEFYWYIGYDRDIHLFASETNSSPFDITESSDNFYNLSVSLDASKIVNRQVVRGASETSSTKTQQDILGDGTKREWMMRNKFRNLSVLVDTGSGYSTQSVGIEFINEDTGSYDYFSNFNAQSVRSGVSASTLQTTSTIRFRYHEVIPIIAQAKDNSSIVALKSLLGNDGIFDGRSITDRTIRTRTEAEAVADVEVAKYSNPIITATFTTNYEGLRSGQIIKITDSTTGRGIDQDFIIQKVKIRPKSEEDGINEYSVKCASTVFGIMEMLQKILQETQNLQENESEQIFNVETTDETMTATESWSTESQNIQLETVSATESWTVREVTPPFTYGPSGSGKDGVWNLSQWS